MSTPDNRQVRIHVYEFDHALLKTPLPNTELYTPESIDFMLNGPALDHLSWYRCLGALADAVRPFGYDARRDYYPWSPTLVDIVVEDMRDPDCLTVLLCYRYNFNAMRGAISHLLQQERLEFWKVHIDQGCVLWEFVDKLLRQFPNCFELSYYGADFMGHKRQIELRDFMERNHPEVDFFWQICPFMSCMIAPYDEFKHVAALVNSYNMSAKNQPVTMKKVDCGLIFKFSFEDRRHLLHLAYSQQDFIPEDDLKLVVSPSICVPLAETQSEESVRRQFINPSRIKFTAISAGCIPNEIYAIKFAYTGGTVDFKYGSSPVAVISYVPGPPPDPSLVKSITNWQRLESPGAGHVFQVSLEHDIRIEIKEVPFRHRRIPLS